ncbi:MAG: glycosyltransferase [Segetibacter sp.]
MAAVMELMQLTFSLTENISAKATEIKNQLTISSDQFVFIFIGRIVQDKGIAELVKAFVQLESKHNNICLLLVGPFEPELDPLPEETIQSIETNPNIVHAGFQSDVRPYLALSDALVFPSYREGFPNVPMQAGCFNLPSIVTDINGCNEIIEHNRNGLIIPPKNAEALKEAMEKILTDEGLYITCKENARKMITERYDQNLFWRSLLAEYQLLLARNKIT